MQLLADALAAHTGETVSGGQLSIGISVAPRALELRLGPLQRRARREPRRRVGDGGLGPCSSASPNRTRSRSAAAGEVLALRLADDARA